MNHQLIETPDEILTRGEIIKGTVRNVTTHENGNRKIECTASENTCYEVGVGPGNG